MVMIAYDHDNPIDLRRQLIYALQQEAKYKDLCEELNAKNVTNNRVISELRATIKRQQKEIDDLARHGRFVLMTLIFVSLAIISVVVGRWMI